MYHQLMLQLQQYVGFTVPFPECMKAESSTVFECAYSGRETMLNRTQACQWCCEGYYPTEAREVKCVHYALPIAVGQTTLRNFLVQLSRECTALEKGIWTVNLTKKITCRVENTI